MQIVVGNFKAELGFNEMKDWLVKFIELYPKEGFPGKKVILCPSVAHLQMTKDALTSAGIVLPLGVQNISHIEKGTYTGEITVSAVSGLAEFVIIGHSERRRNFQDRVDRIQEKIHLANAQGLQVILCTEEIERYQGILFAVAYEPSSAIGNGKPEEAGDSVLQMNKIKSALHADYYLYGGSVNNSNVHNYVQSGFDGVLVGKKTLDPVHFVEVVKNA